MIQIVNLSPESVKVTGFPYKESRMLEEFFAEHRKKLSFDYDFGGVTELKIEDDCISPKIKLMEGTTPEEFEKMFRKYFNYLGN